MKRSSAILCLVLLLAALPLAGQQSYMLAKGDTLFGLSRRFQVPVEVLQTFDRIKDPAGLRAPWLKTVSDAVNEATLVLPKNDWMQQGGRSGRHSEHLGHLLSELQSMPRTFPGATW